MSFEPQPANPFGWLILLILTMFFFVAGVSSSTTLSIAPAVPETRSRHAPREEMAVIPGAPLPDNADLLFVDTIDTVVRESFPPQISLIVSGYWPDGCGIEARTIVRRDGDTVYVRIYRVLPPDVMCTQVMTPVTVNISIDDALRENGEFRSSRYDIDVNGTLVRAAF